MLEKAVLVNERGETLEALIVAVFSVNNKKFIITTNNELDPNGLTVLHVSEVSGEQLVPVANDQDWDAVKNTMRSIISGSANDIKYEPVVSQVSVNGVYSRDISVEKTAFDVMASTYNQNKPVATPELNLPNLQGFDSAVNPFDNSVSNNVTMQNSVKEIAPGISEVTQVPVQNNSNVVDFQPVSNVGSPVDLIDNNVVNQVIDQSNVVQNPVDIMSNQMAMPVQDINPSMVQQPPIDLNMTVQSPVNNISQDVTQMSAEISNQVPAMTSDLMGKINPNSSVDEIINASKEAITAIIHNMVDLLAQRLGEQVQKEKENLAMEKAQIDIMRAGVETKLFMTGAMNGMQPMNNTGMMGMNNGMMQQPMNQPMPQQMVDPNMMAQSQMMNQYQMNTMPNNMMYQQPMNNMGMMNNGMVQPMPQQMMNPNMMQQPMGNVGQFPVDNQDSSSTNIAA